MDTLDKIVGASKKVSSFFMDLMVNPIVFTEIGMSARPMLIGVAIAEQKPMYECGFYIIFILKVQG